MAGPSGGGNDAGLTFRVPNKPCCSSFIPAVKLSEEDLPGSPSPNCNGQIDGMIIGVPLGSVTLPRNAPESKSKAFTEPSPRLPTNSALLKLPKFSKGAHAIPQGESSGPLLVNRLSRFPSVSKMSM